MDVSARTCMFSLLGPQADAVLSTLGANSVAGAADNSHSLLSYSGKPVIVAKGGGLPGPGYTFIADESVAVDVWRALTAQVRRARAGLAAVTARRAGGRADPGWGAAGARCAPPPPPHSGPAARWRRWRRCAAEPCLPCPHATPAAGGC